MAASPLPSRGPTSEQNCYATLAFSRVPNKGHKSNWLPHPCRLGGQQEGGIATHPMHSRGSPKEWIKSKVATSPQVSWGPISGRSGYATPAFSGFPARGTKSKSGYCCHCLFGGAKSGWNCNVALRSRGSPNNGTKSKLPASHLPS